MLVVIVAALVLRADSARNCLVVNYFNRDRLTQPVSFSTVGEMYGDDGTVSDGGVFRLDQAQLLVQPPAQRGSYWFMEFEPHCIVPSSTPVQSSNPEYHRFGPFDSIVFDLQAPPGADFSIWLQGGNLTQCDLARFAMSDLHLSSWHLPDGSMRPVTIPLTAWDRADFRPALGLHSVAFGFAPNPDSNEFRFDNFRLCEPESDGVRTSPMPTRSVKQSTEPGPDPAEHPNSTMRAPLLSGPDADFNDDNVAGHRERANPPQTIRPSPTPRPAKGRTAVRDRQDVVNQRNQGQRLPSFNSTDDDAMPSGASSPPQIAVITLLVLSLMLS